MSNRGDRLGYRCLLVLPFALFLCPLLKSQSSIFVVPSQPWTDTGIQVTQGRPLNITASGLMDYWTGGCPTNLYSCDVTPDGISIPDCLARGVTQQQLQYFIAPTLACWSLIGSIGTEGTPFQVGSSLQTSAPSTGELFLGVNDENGAFGDNTGGWTATISGSCSNPNVTIGTGGNPSEDDMPTTVYASYEPNSGTVDQAATACGFLGFDWQQTIDIWPAPSPLASCNFYSSPLRCLVAISAPDIALSAPPAFLDPVPGGYTYQLPGGDNSNPFYYEPVGYVSNQQGKSTILFQDTPAYPALPSGQYMEFTTTLVGVTSGYKPSSPPLYTFSWVSDFNGTSGGVATSKNPSLADPNSGTGGVTITSINGVAQKPPTATCAASPNNLWPPNGKLVTVTVSGTVLAGTSSLTYTTYSVVDSYGQDQPNDSIVLGAKGSYSLSIPLIASRRGTDLEGRTYTIYVRGQDTIGNVGICSAVVTVPHDQGNN